MYYKKREAIDFPFSLWVYKKKNRLIFKRFCDQLGT